jgi:hypothetical protein
VEVVFRARRKDVMPFLDDSRKNIPATMEDFIDLHPFVGHRLRENPVSVRIPG